MDESENADARLEALLGKRGQDLVRGLIEEFSGLHREIALLKRELAALTEYQSARDSWLTLEAAAAGNARLPRRVVIEPDQLLRQQDGFYGIEHTADNVTFRWTGPSTRFSFDVFIDRTYGADLRLDALNCIDFEIQKDLLLVADGETISLDITPQGTGFVASARLPARDGAEGTNLVFVLPAVLMPPESADQRALGIAFGRLVLVARTASSDAEDLQARSAEQAAAQPPVDTDALGADEEHFTSAAIS